MPKIKPISDLRNYTTVLNDVAIGSPVYLTKSGHGRYAILDINDLEEYELIKAELRLLRELEKGRLSGEEHGYLTAEEVDKYFEDLRHEA